VPLLVFRHINANHGVLVVEQEFGQRFGQLCFSHAGSSHKMNEPTGPACVLQACAAAADGIGHGFDRFILAYHPLVQLRLEVEQFFAFALQHPAHRNARPARNNLGNGLRIHLLVHHRVIALQLVSLAFSFPGGLRFL
jgi:hypothetical protein